MTVNKKLKSALKWSSIVLLVLFVLFNAVSAMQAYKFTHFVDNAETVNSQPSSLQKIKTLFLGMDIPHPQTKQYPNVPYQTVRIQASPHKTLEAWIMPTDSLKRGFFILFHGYVDEKSAMLGEAYALRQMGYDVMLVDFEGAGGSTGNTVTIGYREAEDVKAAYEYAQNTLREKDIYLEGFSMGAAAVAKAQSDYRMNVRAVILEASYGRLEDAVKVRMGRLVDLPSFMKNSLCLWGGLVNGFNVYSMNPEDYVKNITVPVLITGGGKDPNIPVDETQRIYANVASKNKTLVIFPESLHESYLIKHPEKWTQTVAGFLNSLSEINKE
ncbi:alpha-beta hydrolase superfamily lysophospholipase [Dysgonomonas sp. PH5-45]|uniref:alpha/beta hydrolase n=1 Tax=unclassified Dysgonomonas TaxID=2630389 RepID=UPI002474EB48|nr:MULTISPECIES: alpha/beta fold hydrolase [unclassified Dysgonomonas]MDH6354817.1 alpha-beta hydrolase superfamily lysophospholipase [Dysgonomonas sp. PH5-45]MDH6387716.1 alpha-beta hydrolase superfamily lysophospholipase [Dysgonomonas sp. PH5-37]